MEYIGRSIDQAVARFAAAVESGDPSVAAAALGRVRGEHGVGIGPSLDDLQTVHRIVTGTDPPPVILRSFADAWAEAAIGILLTRGALDHHTGLATTDFLTTRLRDLARCGMSASHALVVADGPDTVPTRFAMLLRSVRVARELVVSFPEGETPVGTSGSRVAVIVPMRDDFDANLARARVMIGRVDGIEHGRVRVVELPEEESAVGAFVLDL